MVLRTLLTFLVSVSFVFAQTGMETGGLYIGDNTYVFANDIVLTSTKNIRMETATSNIFLRNNAQLYQIEDYKNLDAGELSVYQEQTTGIYEYNYWCSPVGVSVDGTTQANVSFKGSNTIHDPTDDTDVTDITSSDYAFTTSYDGTATELSNKWLYKFVSGDGVNGWSYLGDTGSLPSGCGFTLKGSPNTNNTLDFRGRPNNGNITVDCTFNGTDADPNSGLDNQVSTLTGNPYPSALDVKKFVEGNAALISGDIMYWEQAVTNSHNSADYQGGYGVYTIGTPGDYNDHGNYVAPTFETYDTYGNANGDDNGTGTDFSTLSNFKRRYASIGQGFFIESIDNGGAPGGGTVTFTNAMRVYLPQDVADGAIFAKNNIADKSDVQTAILNDDNIEASAVVPEIRIHTEINETYYKEIVIAFRESTPNNYTYNRFYDGINHTETNSDVYMISEDKELVIKSINYNEDVFIPFGVRLEGLNPSINVNVFNLENTPENLEIYLYDIENDCYTDIINNPLTLNLEAGLYNERFKIVFKNESTLTTNHNIVDGIKIYQNNNVGELRIINSKGLKINSFSLYDVSGKQVFLDENFSSDGLVTYSTKPYADGVYITKLTTETGETVTKKIIVSNCK